MNKKVFMMLASCIIIWGAGVPILKVGVMSMNVHAYSLMRFIVTSVVCLIILFFEKDFKIDKKDILPMICIGFFFVFLQQKLYNEGTYKTTAGNSALICILSIILGVIWLGEKFSLIMLLGSFFTIYGVLITQMKKHDTNKNKFSSKKL